VTGALGTLKSSAVTQIARAQNVTAAAGALSATDLSISGKVPTASNGNGGGGFGGGFGGGGGGGPTSIKTSTFAVLGVDTGAGRVGPLSSDKIASGRTFTAAEASSDVALLDANYARQHKLAAGSKVTVGSATFTVIGTVAEPQGGTTTDVYIPLQRAQSLAGMSGKVNTIYVAAASATDISAVQQAIQTQLPKATVTTSSDLASQVTGSLSSASSLAGTLGKWLAIVVLIAAFAMASLLTMAAVSRRVREFGTLKALGWRSRRIVGQVMGETLVIGLAGGVAGIALGFAGAALVTKFVGPLSATTGASAGSASPGFGPPGGGRLGGGGPFGRAANDAAKTILVHLDAPVTIGIVVLAVLLAVAGGLIAGMFGGWRAARLRPAAALAQVR